MPPVDPLKLAFAAPDAATQAAADADPRLARAEARLDQVEAFGERVGEAIDKLVTSLLELKERDRSAEVAALQAKVRELEQALDLERANRDLAAVSRSHPKARSLVFVGTTYLGCNVKYAWLAARAAAGRHGYRCWFLPFTAEQEAQVRGVDREGCFPHAPAEWSAEHVRAALGAAVVVTSDHLLNPNPFAAAMLAGARHVQLWHGVSIKEIGYRNLAPLRAMGPHYARVLATCGPYASLVGTAAAHESEWRRWFSFERYAPLGYARNDVLYRTPEGTDLLNVDADAFGRAGRARAAGKRVVLYAPTFRDGKGVRWLLEAGLDRIAQAIAAAGDCLIVNLHPVEAPAVPELAKHLPGVTFVRPRTDIYPLLTQTSALVTDYSSVMFDYLHLDRPILLYRPDHEEYARKSRKLFDDKLDPAPGPVVTTGEALVRAIQALAMDPFAPQRRQLRGQLYDNADGLAGQRLVEFLAGELSRVPTTVND